jgi:hypothetical protein
MQLGDAEARHAGGGKLALGMAERHLFGKRHALQGIVDAGLEGLCLVEIGGECLGKGCARAAGKGYEGGSKVFGE